MASPKANKANQNSGPSKKASQKQEQSSSSFLVILFGGFVALLLYTIWTSINTYSNQLQYDME